MTNLLLRLFIKDYKNPKSPAVRSAVGVMAGMVGIICNLLLACGKMVIGVISASISITADALNNFSDAASSMVTLAGFQLAKRPADKDHPYGHGRYEYLAGLAVSVLILFIGFELMKSSVSRIFQPEPSGYNWITVAVLLVSMGVKLWMSIFFRKLGRHIDSTALKATSIDSRNDVITTTAVLVGCLCEFIWKLPLDGYIGLGLSVFILYSGIRSARETVSPLLGAQADESLIQELSALILSHEKILGIHDLLVHDYGPGRCYASVHAEVSAKYDPITCHEIIDHIEAEVSAKLNVQLVIHFDPICEDDPEQEQLQAIIEMAVSEMGADLSIHDLRIIKKAKQPLISFDLTAPYDTALDLHALENCIFSRLPPAWKNYKLSIQVDRE